MLMSGEQKIGNNSTLSACACAKQGIFHFSTIKVYPPISTQGKNDTFALTAFSFVDLSQTGYLQMSNNNATVSVITQ